MRIPYKSRPITRPRAGFPTDRLVWRPILPVRLSFQRKVSELYDTLVDSGSDVCVFDLSIAEEIGVSIDHATGREVGIVGIRAMAFPAKVHIMVDSESFESQVIFFDGLPIAGLLGRLGFFDNFKVTFDHSTKPPSLVYERIAWPT